jgi:hypothetical protein
MIFGEIEEEDCDPYYWFGSEANWGDDYSLNWDYETEHPPNPDVHVEIADTLCNHEQLIAELGFEGVRWGYVCMWVNACIAKYISGTKNYPFFIFDSIRVLDISEREGKEIGQVVEETLLHEYAHAWFDCACAELDRDFEEEKANEFSALYSKNRNIEEAIKFLESVIKEN